MTMNGDEQYERGLEALRQADGGAGQKLLDALGDVSPNAGLTPSEIVEALL